jgi:hypothetical protein
MKKSQNVLVVTHVPRENLAVVQKAVWFAGAWVEWSYKNCGFVIEGKWFFTPFWDANPAIWEVWKSEEVEEYHFEFTCRREILEDVITELKKAHPYEEVPVQINEYFEV